MKCCTQKKSAVIRFGRYLQASLDTFLLEKFSGAAAAYSLRKLSKDTTNVIRVRRSSDNAEQDFTSDEVFDGTLEAFVGAGNDGFVATWYDQSGEGNDATQASATNQPKVVDSGSLIVVNSYNVIQYDGSDDNLGTSLTATGTMLMAGSEGSGFYEVDINGSYDLLSSAGLTDHPLNETIRVIWNRSLSAGEKSQIEDIVTYTDWDFGGVTNFFNYWRQRDELTSFPELDVSSGLIFNRSWFGCSLLTSFPLIDVSSGTSFSGAWNACSSLTSFPELDVSSGANFSTAWRDCSSLTSFPELDVSSGTNFIAAWDGCSSLTSFPFLNFSSAINFVVAWRDCSALEDFPANMFDTVTATNFSNAFLDTNLTQTSIDNILVSIDTAGQSNGTFDQSGGSAPSATGEAAIDNLRARGWTVTVTGGYQTYAEYKYRVEQDGGTLYSTTSCTLASINNLKSL